MGQQGEATC